MTLRKDIGRCMVALSTNGAHFDAGFVFPADFSGFNGHFPDTPVLPGVCAVQAVLVALEAWKKQPVKLLEITNAKFFAPVSPGDKLQFACEAGAAGVDPMLVKADISNDGKKIAQLRLKVSCPGAGEIQE